LPDADRSGVGIVPPPPEENHREIPDRLAGTRILIADDDHQVRTVAARILHGAGAVVIEAASAEEARRACVTDDAPIDVLVSDLVLADGQGDALARPLCELRPNLRVVLVSGFPASAIGRNAAAPGRVLNKPFTPSELRAAVNVVLEERKQESGERPPT